MPLCPPGIILGGRIEGIENLGEVLWEARSRDLASSPSLWLILEARQRPREVQAIAYEKGLILYFPADRQAE